MQLLRCMRPCALWKVLDAPTTGGIGRIGGSRRERDLDAHVKSKNGKRAPTLESININQRVAFRTR